MSMNYRIKDEDGLLRVISTGSCEDLTQLKEYVLAIHNAKISLGQTKILVDETRLEYQLSTIDTFDSGRFISQLSPKPQKIAVLCRPDGRDDAEFWETVAVNRGVFVRVFEDRDDAEAWLRD